MNARARVCGLRIFVMQFQGKTILMKNIFIFGQQTKFQCENVGACVSAFRYLLAEILCVN